MPFPEALRFAVRKRAHHRCCVCHLSGVEVHHIVPQPEGGPDDWDNAAPLCPSCHDTYGANPVKRKFIREARDVWYEICDKRYQSDDSRLAAIEETLRSVATKEDVRQLAIQNTRIVLGAADTSRGASPSPKSQYSFEHEEFIHPLIVRELVGWLSDPAETVVAVDLTSANNSNRFFGQFSIRPDSSRIWVEWIGTDRESFAYSHLATTPSGIQIVECYDCPGGTGVFGSIALLSIESDQTLQLDVALAPRSRTILKTLGSIGLGDRYVGKIDYRDGLLIIGVDEGSFKAVHVAQKTLKVH